MSDRGTGDWPDETLRSLSRADFLNVQMHKRDDGTTATVSLWFVVIEDGVFVRAHSKASRWYQLALSTGEGVMHIENELANVSFDRALDSEIDLVDLAFDQKYGGSVLKGTRPASRFGPLVLKVSPGRS